jgi:putative flavoprotein involved in K+ transport
MRRTEHVDTLIIGGGQAGLCLGYHLARRDVSFLVVDANGRTGDSWRERWDSLRLFTPNRFNGLPGLPFPGAPWDFPTKDEVADYLEVYRHHFELPVRNGLRVERLTRTGDRFVAETDTVCFEADNVAVAMASWQQPRLPTFAGELDPRITQVHASGYRNPAHLRDGEVLVVGAGNSGAEIALELAASHTVWLSGPDTGQLPFRPHTIVGHLLLPLVGKVILHRLLSTSTPIGRRVRPKLLGRGEPLLRVKRRDLVAAGVVRVPRTVGVDEGQPVLEDGRRLAVDNVVWCTGFEPGFAWVDLPVFDGGQVRHRRGVVDAEPGLFFLGLKFLHAPSSSNLPGISRDAAYVADRIVARRRVPAAA